MIKSLFETGFFAAGACTMRRVTVPLSLHYSRLARPPFHQSACLGEFLEKSFSRSGRMRQGYTQRARHTVLAQVHLIRGGATALSPLVHTHAAAVFYTVWWNWFISFVVQLGGSRGVSLLVWQLAEVSCPSACYTSQHGSLIEMSVT